MTHKTVPCTIDLKALIHAVVVVSEVIAVRIVQMLFARDAMLEDIQHIYALCQFAATDAMSSVMQPRPVGELLLEESLLICKSAVPLLEQDSRSTKFILFNLSVIGALLNLIMINLSLIGRFLNLFKLNLSLPVTLRNLITEPTRMDREIGTLDLETVGDISCFSFF